MVVSGFFYNDKKLITLQYPGSRSTYVTGINDHGTIVGYAILFDESVQGFIGKPRKGDGVEWFHQRRSVQAERRAS
ncbi:MAG: hypothetical protein HY308_08340 [Gammaproteobacteria bacterium]|nr:hypothetical protein [Gammaproteobacteria bacterium]